MLKSAKFEVRLFMQWAAFSDCSVAGRKCHIFLYHYSIGY